MVRFTALFLIINSWEALSITTRTEQKNVRNFRRHIGPPPADWELGLREAVHQALLREHHTHPGLRDQLLEAPLIGRQHNASPFGDIAVLARGQLYDTAEGFKFVQDSDQDDCEECHRTNRCLCQPWKSLGHHHKLLALWTVKRIRHRDPHYGHVFEIEYTISPITSAINEELVRRHGYFNYNVPGHIFVIKSDPRLNSAYYLNNAGDKWYKNPAIGEQYPADHHRGSGHFKPGILIGVSPDGFKHVLHSFPGFYTSYHPQTSYHDHTTIDPKEYELYKKLIESLASKTTPHRFAITPSKQTTVPTTLVPLRETTFVQLVPLTENTPAPTTTSLHVVTPVGFPSTSETSVFDHTVPTTTTLPTLEPPRPITVPVTTVHYYTPVEELPETVKNTPPSRTSTITTWKPSKTTMKTTKPMLPQEEELDLFPVNTSTEPMKPVTELPQRTRPDSVNEQLPSPEKDADTTIPYVSSTQPTTVTQRTTTFVTTPRETTAAEQTTVFVTAEEAISATTPQKETPPHVTSGATTVFVTSVTTPQEETAVTEKRTTFAPSTKGETTATMVIERIPYTEITTTAAENVKTTEAEKTTENFSTTQNLPPTRTISKPTTIVEYSFDSTTRGYTETVGSTKGYTETIGSTKEYTKTESTIGHTETVGSTKGYTETVGSSSNTQGFTNTPTAYYPTTETVKLTIPTTTTHYYYTFDTNSPKTDEVTVTTAALATTQQLPQALTPSEDFLVDTEEDTNKVGNGKKDFDEDDIFGKAPTKTASVETTTKRVVIQSDIAQALFDNRRPKYIKVSSKLRRPPATNIPKIIYNHFYLPSTESPTTTARNSFYDTTTSEARPYTDQSYSTSISFEVNKRNSTNPIVVHIEPTRAEISEVVNHDGDYKIYKAELPAEQTSQTKKAFDDLALQVVNHARSIEYLNKKPTRQYKWRNRSMKPRRSRNQKKSNRRRQDNQS